MEKLAIDGEELVKNEKDDQLPGKDLTMNLAVITARGGSKRIPKKNIRKFCGKPIISYSIQAALESGIFHDVIISTDSEEIAEIGKSFGANIPFMRSEKTSNDVATTSDVLHEVVKKYESLFSRKIEVLCCLYPTAPFVTGKKLMDAYQKMVEAGGHGIMPVVKFSYPPQRAVVKKEGRLQFQYPQYAKSRSQDLPDIFHDCGQFYIYQCSEYIKHSDLVIPKMIPYITNECEVQDIDNESDWELAEFKYLFNSITEEERKEIMDRYIMNHAI